MYRAVTHLENKMASLLTGDVKGQGKTSDKLSSSKWSSDCTWTAVLAHRKFAER